ncbi:hypothetical protein FB480_109107 [Agrobacterium vitis]|nr:hypothetical protein FB480_109107 [Agrobacterium vitis]
MTKSNSILSRLFIFLFDKNYYIIMLIAMPLILYEFHIDTKYVKNFDFFFMRAQCDFTYLKSIKFQSINSYYSSIVFSFYFTIFLFLIKIFYFLFGQNKFDFSYYFSIKKKCGDYLIISILTSFLMGISGAFFNIYGLESSNCSIFEGFSPGLEGKTSFYIGLLAVGTGCAVIFMSLQALMELIFAKIRKIE